jgi:putative NIF3 family GTP cyclohydrolase 1 type 2
VKRGLGLASLLVAAPEGRHDASPITTAAACAGACGALIDDAIAQGAELYLTGELRHHDALRAVRSGLTVVCTLHSNSERAALGRFKERLSERLPGLRVILSATDRDPFVIR